MRYLLVGILIVALAILACRRGGAVGPPCRAARPLPGGDPTDNPRRSASTFKAIVARVIGTIAVVVILTSASANPQVPERVAASSWIPATPLEQGQPGLSISDRVPATTPATTTMATSNSIDQPKSEISATPTTAANGEDLRATLSEAASVLPAATGWLPPYSPGELATSPDSHVTPSTVIPELTATFDVSPTPTPSSTPIPDATPHLMAGDPVGGGLNANGTIGGPRVTAPDQGFRVYFPNVSLGEPSPRPYRVYIPFAQGSEQRTPTATPTTTPTATPNPTPTLPGILPMAPPIDLVWALEQQPLRSVDRQSKIGIGVYADGGGFALNETLRLRPGLVVLMDPKPEFAREIRKLLPKAFIIGRRFVKYQPLDDPEARGAAFADYVAELAVPLRGVVDGWMSYNEPVGRGDVAGFQAYNTFQVAFAKRLQGTYGIGAVAGNDPPGAVDIPEYPKYFGEAIRISKFFGIHSYSSPESSTLREQDADWHVLRHRRIHRALQDAGIKSGPIVITETGLAKGWRQMGANTESVVADFTWLADEVARDDYVMGFAIFGIFTTPGWESFDLSGTRVLDLLARYDPDRPLRIPEVLKKPPRELKK